MNRLVPLLPLPPLKRGLGDLPLILLSKINNNKSKSLRDSQPSLTRGRFMQPQAFGSRTVTRAPFFKGES